MSMTDKKGMYVYQPYGSLSNPIHNAAGRLYGVGGGHLLMEIKGLTRLEAFKVVRALDPESEHLPENGAIV